MRLVGLQDPATNQAWSHQDLVQDISRENQVASRLSLQATDPRWLLARMAYTQLQQGPLTPGQREHLVGRARTMGLRPFDASLIIAIAQDHARTGRGLEDVEPTLRLVRPVKTAPATRATSRMLLALVLAMGITGLLLAWLAG